MRHAISPSVVLGIMSISSASLGAPQATLAPQVITTAGDNLRISGSSTQPHVESDIRINFFNPLQIVAASNVAGGLLGVYFSIDGGATWGQSSLPLGTDNAQSDPSVDWTSDSTTWATAIAFPGTLGGTTALRAFKSSDGGATWTLDATLDQSTRTPVPE